MSDKSKTESRSLPSQDTLREHAELLAHKTLLAKREIEWRASVLAKAWLAQNPVVAPSSEIGVRISPDLYRRILEQHELAAEALVDSHGDVHREIVAALKNAAPQVAAPVRGNDWRDYPRNAREAGFKE